MSDPESEPLEVVAADLADTLDALRAELESERRRPPRAVDLLRFTERYTIPAVVAVLEANVRMLELLAGSIRVATREEGDDRRASAAGSALGALDGALRDASRALSGGEPSNREARELLREARELRAELDERLEAAATDRDGEAGDGEGKDGPVSVDVDAELDSIRDEVDEERTAGSRFDDGRDDE